MEQACSIQMTPSVFSKPKISEKKKRGPKLVSVKLVIVGCAVDQAKLLRSGRGYTSSMKK